MRKLSLRPSEPCESDSPDLDSTIAERYHILTDLLPPAGPAALSAISTRCDPAHVRGAALYDRKRYVLSGAKSLPGLIVNNIVPLEGQRLILVRRRNLPGGFVRVIRRDASFWHLL